MTFDELTHAVCSIHDDVRNGRLPGAEAQARLALLRESNPNPEPDTAYWDPSTELYWSLPMLLAWMVWRSTQKVLDYSPEYRGQRLFWGKVKVPDNTNFQAPSFCLDGLVRTRSTDILKELREAAHLSEERVHMSAYQAEKELKKALITGKPKATAVYEDRRTDIPPREFCDLYLTSARHHDGSDDVEVRYGRLIYEGVRLPRSQVQMIWPVERSRGASKAHKQLCYDMLVKDMTESPHTRLKTRPEYLHEIRRQVAPARFSEPLFDEQWNKAIEDTGARAWRGPGRPRKSRSGNPGAI